MGASVDEAVAAVVLAVDGRWDAIDGAGPAPVELDRGRVERLAPDLLIVAGEAIADPHLLGAVHELGLAATDRRGRGVHFTPAEVSRGLVERAVDGWVAPGPGGARVLDPACGGGAFLLAARSVLGAGTVLAGADVDGRAVWSARLALRGEIAVEVVTADPIGRPATVGSGFDLVVGNPPFLPQRRRATARDDTARSSVRDRFGDVLGPYADGALVFLLDALERVAPGGRVAMILPWSIVASRDARRLRELLAPDLQHVWIGGPGVFPGAFVQVCAVVVEPDTGRPLRGVTPHPIGRSFGRAFSVLPARSRPEAGEWGGLLADALGLPEVPEDLLRRWGHGPTLGDLATVTAGFRDEFYAISAAVTEAAPGGDRGSFAPSPDTARNESSRWRPVVSVGMIDALDQHWGRRPVRIGGRSFLAPVVDPAEVADPDTRVGRWLKARLVPKVLVATQTKVIEAVVDESGLAVPLTPTLSVEPHDSADLWRIAAALTGPVATLLAGRRTAGTALASGAIKVAAADLRALPVPVDASAWAVAAEHARSVAAHPTAEGWKALAAVHLAAFGSDDESLVPWWLSRLGSPTRGNGADGATRGNKRA